MAQVTRVQLFGRPEMVRADGTPAALDSRKSLALLAYLVRQRRPLARASLAALLWADLPEARGRRNLSRELTQLTALLPDSIQADHASVTWSGRAAWVDVAMAAELLQPRPAGTPASSLVEAVALYRGPFMEGFTLDNSAEFESWLLQEREQWQQRITAALEQLITQSVEQGEYGLAQQHTRRWLELEPWQEEAHRTLMLLLARSGQRSAALAQFEACRRALARELDIEPSHELIALAEQIRTGALAPPRPGQATGAAAQAAQPPTTTRDTPGAGAAAQHWSPIPSPGRFYGRAAELAALHELLESRRCRVVAVLGMGGVGKTTLAAQATRALAPGFDAVVWRSLLNAPPLHELLRACLQALACRPRRSPSSSTTSSTSCSTACAGGAA
jgi:DNA-binding SARP family transcriptional activator